MASTGFELSVRVIVFTLTIAVAAFPTSADQETCNAVTTCRLGKQKLIVKTTITPRLHNESKITAYSKYGVEVRNHIAIKRLKDEMDTMTSESTSMAARCSFEETASVNMGSLLDAGEGAMVSLVAGKTRLVAHRAILAARSPVFAAMLCRGTQESSSDQVAIPDVEGPVLRQILTYLYTLQVPQMSGMPTQLLEAADKFGLSALKAACEEQVATQLSVETAAATAVLAIRHSCTSLRDDAIAFIRARLVPVMATKGWADAVRYHTEDMIEVYRLLADLAVESSTSSAAVNQTTTEDPSLPYSGQGKTPVATTQDSQATTEVLTVPYNGQGQTPVATATVSQPTTEGQSLDQNGHGETSVAAPSASPLCHTPPPDDDAVSRLRGLSAEEMGQGLIQAAKEGAVEDVQALLAVGANVVARDCRMLTALHWAAYKGHVGAVRILLACGAEVDARTKWQHTPLHLAADSGHLEVVRSLLDAGAEVDAKDGLQQTPLHLAAENGHAGAVRLLLEYSADSNARQEDGWTPLLLAASYGHAAVVQLLVASSADVNVRGEDGWTPLHHAAIMGHTEAAAALLEAGADKEARADDGRTPLDLATQQNHQQTIDMLTGS